MSRRTPTTYLESLEGRLAKEAVRLRDEAELLPPGALRDAALRQARQAETGAQIGGWLDSHNLQTPK